MATVKFKFFTCEIPGCCCVTINKVERVVWGVKIQKRICKRHAAEGAQ